MVVDKHDDIGEGGVVLDDVGEVCHGLVALVDGDVLVGAIGVVEDGGYVEGGGEEGEPARVRG